MGERMGKLKCFFPYKPREGQEELMEFILRSVDRGAVCLNASTGFGKTPAILAALLPRAKRGRIIWAVRTGNETDRPIEELKVINEVLGKEFFGLSYRGKRDMCLLARDLTLEGEMDYQDVAFLCENRRRRCEYYLGLDSLYVEDFLDGPKLYSEILNRCRELGVCPYFAQRELLPYADVVSLSYNYIIHEGMSWSVRRLVPFESSYLVVDEAHNLQSACGNLNSDRITFGTLTYALREISRFESLEARRVENFINRLRDELYLVFKEMRGEEAEFDPGGFLNGFLRKIGSNMDGLLDVLDSMNSFGFAICIDLVPRKAIAFKFLEPITAPAPPLPAMPALHGSSSVSIAIDANLTRFSPAGPIVAICAFSWVSLLIALTTSLTFIPQNLLASLTSILSFSIHI